MRREYDHNVRMDIRDLEIEQQNDPFSRFITSVQKFFEIVNFQRKTNEMRREKPPDLW